MGLIPAKLLDYDIWHGRRRQSRSTRNSSVSATRGDSDEIEVCTIDGGCYPHFTAPHCYLVAKIPSYHPYLLSAASRCGITPPQWSGHTPAYARIGYAIMVLAASGIPRIGYDIRSDPGSGFDWMRLMMIDLRWSVLELYVLGSLDKTADLWPRVRKRGKKETVLPETAVLVCFLGLVGTETRYVQWLRSSVLATERNSSGTESRFCFGLVSGSCGACRTQGTRSCRTGGVLANATCRSNSGKLRGTACPLQFEFLTKVLGLLASTRAVFQHCAHGHVTVLGRRRAFARGKTSGVARLVVLASVLFSFFLLPLFHNQLFWVSAVFFDCLGGCAGGQVPREGHNLADPRAERSLVVWGLAKRTGPDGGFGGGGAGKHTGRWLLFRPP